MKIVITGGRGMLASDLAPHLAGRGHEVIPADLPECDITRTGHLIALLDGADAVINCAAYTNVDGAETNADLARRVNAEAVGNLGRLAAERGVYVLHISTDFVFDGAATTPYVETDTPNPLGVYGLTKWEGEQALAAAGCRHAIVRAQWTYGVHGHHFISKLLDFASRLPRLKVVDDQVGSPTPTTLAAELLGAIVERRLEGTYHMAANGYASRYQVARLIADHLGLTIPIDPCPSSDFPTAARRPLNSRFDCRKLDSALGCRRAPWQEYLTHYLEHQK